MITIISAKILQIRCQHVSLQMELNSYCDVHPSWNESYASGQLPWDTGQPEPLLVEFVASSGIKPGPALEIGAGTGTNAIWMAERGFNVLGVDVSPLAVEKARARMEARALPCRFEALDFLAGTPPGGPFQF